MENQNEPLRERILSAMCGGVIDELLQEGATYTNASQRTRNRWQIAAAKRRKELLRGEPVNA